MKTLMVVFFLFACGGEPPVVPPGGAFTIEDDEVVEDMEPDTRPPLGTAIPCYHQQWDGCRPLPDKRDYLINPNPGTIPNVD